MSQTVMTAAFGSADRRRATPRSVRVFAQLVAGGSGVFIFYPLEAQRPGAAAGGPVRLRPVGVSGAQTLMSGLALADTAIPLEGPAGDVAERLRTSERDITLTAADAAVLSEAVADLAISLVVTGVAETPSVSARDFAGTGWSVHVGVARRRADGDTASE
jgi:hypothetical protein